MKKDIMGKDWTIRINPVFTSLINADGNSCRWNSSQENELLEKISRNLNADHTEIKHILHSHFKRPSNEEIWDANNIHLIIPVEEKPRLTKVWVLKNLADISGFESFSNDSGFKRYISVLKRHIEEAREGDLRDLRYMVDYVPYISTGLHLDVVGAILKCHNPW